MNAKFERNDHVIINKGKHKGEKAIIVDRLIPNEDTGRSAYIINYNSNNIKLFEEYLDKDLEYVEPEKDVFLESLKAKEYIPKYKMGDVLDGPDWDPKYRKRRLSRRYVIQECIETIKEDGSSEFSYLVNWNHSYMEGITYTFTEEELFDYKYTDENWCEVFTEHMSNNLPEWRGELYNYDIIYNNLTNRFEPADKVTMDEYSPEKYTLPIKQLDHIMKRHTIWWRGTLIMNNKDKKHQEMKKHLFEKFNFNSYDEMENFFQIMCDKIVSRNRSKDMSNEQLKNFVPENKCGFTTDEINFALEIDKIDEENGRKISHFPLEMTSLQIMKNIYEAYRFCKKQGKRQIVKIADESKGSLPAPEKGKVLYRGMSQELIIDFWYNFDYDIIEIAYPVSKRYY